MLGQQNTLDFSYSGAPLPALVPSTSKMVDALKEENQDFEWYPSTTAQIKIITDDIKALQERYFIGSRSYHGEFSFLDVGSKSSGTERRRYRNEGLGGFLGPSASR